MTSVTTRQFFGCILALVFSPLIPGLPCLQAASQNKIVTRDFRWQIQTLPHFDYYYYGASGAALVPYAAQYLESAFDRVTGYLPVAPKEKAPFFLYNNHNDFEETNITDVTEGTGGVTEAFKDRFLIGHLGPQRYLQYVITHEFTHEIEYQYLFGGFWRSARLLKFIFYPNWLMEGLAEYSYGDLDRTTREMYIRDAATSNRLFPLEQLHSFNHVMPHQVTLAYKESEAFIRYLVEEYGRERLPQFLISYQDRFDANIVLMDVIGTDLFTIDRKFREYLEDTYRRLSTGLDEPSVYGRRITPEGYYPRFYESAVFSPDGKSIAYLSDETGNFDVYLMDIATQKSRRIWGLTKSIEVESIHTDGNGLAFSPDGKTLAFAGERIQRDYLFIYDIAANRLEEIETHTETVASPAFSPDGMTIYFSGIRDGFRDLFSIDRGTKKVTQLTETPTDEIDAVVSPDGRFLVYAAERESPAGRLEYDLCRMRLATGTTEYAVALPGDERFPWFSPDGKKLSFTSDASGILDVYVQDLEGGRIDRLTRVIGGNFQPRFSPDGTSLLFASFRKGDQHLYLGPLEKLSPAARETASPFDQTVSSRSFAGAVPPAFPIRPYRFRFSTDLFFPALFYSSVDGLYIAALWQASDFLGNHQFQVAGDFASGAQYLDYQATYAYLRYRTKLYFSFAGQEYYTDIQQTVKRKEYLQSVLAAYPLNRFQQLGLLLGTIDRQERNTLDPAASFRKRENIAGLQFLHDTTQGPYLEVTSGWRAIATAQFSAQVLSGDYGYQDYSFETDDFFPLGREHVLGWRLLAAGSFGPDARLLRLGGADRVRGLPAGDQFAGTKVFINSLEWRFPLIKNINYHMWYIFPDFFFKTLYGSAFIDAGTAWNTEDEFRGLTLDQWKGSFGVGVRQYTFILQSYPLLLNLQVARRFDVPDYVLYLLIGTNF